MPAVSKVIQAQRDFSAGEIDVSAKRGDENPILKAGARQMANMRILNSRAVQNRPGRRVLFRETGRIEEVLMSPGSTFFLVFGAGTLKVYNAAGSVVFSQAGFAWALATVGKVVWTQAKLAIYITFPGMTPQVLSWDGVATWSIAAFAFLVSGGGQIREPFYRISPQGVTMLPSATTGNITLTFSSGIAVAGMVGTKMRFCTRQLSITGFTNSTTLSATVIEPLPPGQVLTVTVDPRTIFNVGDVIVGATSSARGVITALSATTVTVQLTSTSATISGGGSGGPPVANPGFVQNESIAGPGGSDTIGAGGVATTTPQAVAVWDDELFNSFRGWPQSVFFDQARLGFCNIPALPAGIIWSALDQPTDFYIDSPPTAAILDIAPDKVQVLYVIPGPESSEFVFCDRRIYYIPIAATNPLKPGSVGFQTLSGDGAAQVQPRVVQEVILYINSGGTSVMSIVAPGAYYRPYETRNLSELHAHLIKTPIAIAIPTATSTFEERYAYVLNSDGTIAAGKYNVASGQIQGVIGWVPWSGAGTVKWIAALGSDVIFTSSYFGGAVNIVEILDDTQYLDAMMAVNSAPAALAPPGGGLTGPLWWLAGRSVVLIDLGTRIMDTYQVDTAGNIVPRQQGGENLASSQLVAGQPWTATLEPFVPAVPGGQDQLQRMRPRRIARADIYVANSTGFRFDTLAAEQQGRNLPVPGTVLRTRRIPAWNQDDDSTQPPPLRENAYTFKPTGRSHDPRVAAVKDTSGPLQILEIGFEVSV